MPLRNSFLAQLVFRSAQIGVILLFFALTTAAMVAVRSQYPEDCFPGRYSAEAVQADFRLDPFTAAYPIYSPDGQKAFRIDDDRWSVEVRGKKIAARHNRMDSSWVEVGWAPDGNTFFISHSVGYTTGYRVDVYRQEGDSIRRFANLNRVVQKDFEHRHRCYDRDWKIGNDPNIAGLKWLDNSDRLLLVAEVPNLGICKQTYFAGYLVSISSGRIIQRYSPEDLLRRWEKLLGENLLSDLHFMSEAEKAALP
jgi:hypothetical protein